MSRATSRLLNRTTSPRTPSHKHRAERPARMPGVWRRTLTAAVATAATGVAVVAGVAAASPSLVSEGDPAAAQLAASIREAPVHPQALARLESARAVAVSRSADRTLVDHGKLDRLRDEARSGGQVTRTKDLGSGDPKAIARSMMAQFGFSADQFDCLDSLWTRESGWNPRAANPTSSAYGIPQALPGSKMATAGADWATNPATQIRWGLGYIRASYGTPCGAWSHSEGYGWY